LQAIGWALLIFGVAFGAFMLGSAAVGAGWEPTSREKVRKMLRMSGVGPSDVVDHLGSGDGRIIVEAARTYHATAVGIEADPLRVLFSRAAISLLHLKERVSVIWGNFFNVDLSKATVVTIFLSQGTNRRLKPKLMSELRPGARVVSFVWTFEDWTPVARDSENRISVYLVPGQTRST